MTSSAEQAPPPPSIEEQVTGWKQYAEYLRAQVKALVPPYNSPPEVFRERLLAIRAHQDTLEEALALAIAARGALKRAAETFKDDFEEAWADAAAKGNAASYRRGNEMQGPRERYADYDVATLPQRRAWRQQDLRLMLLDEVLDTLWLRYRAVNATREDIIQAMRSAAMESSLDR